MSEYRPLTDDELAEWKQLCDAATTEPWGRIKRNPSWIYDGAASSIGSMDFEKDTAWIIAARTEWPRCIAEIKRLRAENKELREKILEILVRNHCAEMDK